MTCTMCLPKHGYDGGAECDRREALTHSLGAGLTWLKGPQFKYGCLSRLLTSFVTRNNKQHG